MSRVAPVRTRRSVAAVLLGLLSLAGVTIGAALPASAAGASDDYVELTWLAPELLVDHDGDGYPDVGDAVDLPFKVTAGDRDITEGTITVEGYSNGPINVRAGESREYRHGPFLVDEGNLDPRGGGVVFASASFTYFVDGLGPLPLELAPPPPTFPVDPLTVVETTVDIDDGAGGSPAVAGEGDVVQATTTVRNDSEVDVTVTNPDGTFGSDQFPATVEPGATVELTTDPVTVTYDDMVAGSVDFPDATLAWQAPSVDGTLAVGLGSQDTEAVEYELEASVVLEVATAEGDDVRLGDAQAGDVVHYSFQVTNASNIVLPFMIYHVGPFPDGFLRSGSASTNSLAPGESLPAGDSVFEVILSSMPDASSLSPYVLSEADVDRGYVDLDFSIALAPSQEEYFDDRGRYTADLSQRVFLREFTTDAALEVTATLDETNGDGVGQEGEHVFYRWELTNESNQAMTLDALTDAAGAGIALADGSTDGTVVPVGDRIGGTYRYELTAADEARGGVAFGLEAALTGAVDGESAAASGSAPTIATGAYVAPPATLTADLTYVDDNGDGKANMGETVTVTVTLTNDGAYTLRVPVVWDSEDADISGLMGGIPDLLAPGEEADESFQRVITADDLARGSITYGASMVADGMAAAIHTTPVVLPVEPYVAPAHALTIDADYGDANAVGAPSIGETVTLTLTLANEGAYPLTGIVVADSPDQDEIGLYENIPARLGPGEQASVTYDVVLTAEDYARGSFTYSAYVTAHGAPEPMHASASVEGITFQAYEDDLDGVAAGGIAICDGDGDAVEMLVIGDDYAVLPGDCGYDGTADGFRAVAFSEPMLLAADAFAVTVPAGLGEGAHRVALYGPDGTLVGWQSVTVEAPAELASTGVARGDLWAASAVALLLALLGSTLVLRSSARPVRP